MQTDPRSFLKAGPTRPHVDQAARAVWLAVVQASARTLGGAVTTSAEEPTVGRNHYRIGVRVSEGGH